MSDLDNFVTLLALSWLWGAALLVFLAIFCGVSFYLVLDFAKNSPKQRRQQFVWKMALLLLATLLAYFGAVKQWFVHFYDHSQFLTSMQAASKQHGRLSTFIYDAYVTREIRRNLTARTQETPAAINQALFGNVQLQKPRNLYIVMLESFIDPRLIENLTFSRDPLAEGLKNICPADNFLIVNRLCMAVLRRKRNLKC